MSTDPAEAEIPQTPLTDVPSPQDLAGLAAHPHDHFFKRVFQSPERAREFFQAHLPAEMAAQLNWESLCCQPTSFIHADLKDSASDLLFSIQAGARPLQLYLLWEHQSTVVPHMPLRLLSYMVKIWEKSYADNGLPLPVVIPLVLHQGPEKWTVDSQFISLFGLSDSENLLWGNYLPNFCHLLTDLTQRNLTGEPLNPTLKTILYLMQTVRIGRELTKFFEWLAPQEELLSQLPAGLEKLLILYALHGEERLDPEEIYLRLQHNKRLQSDTMSTAQYLINQGIEKGIERGMEKGIEKGIEKGMEKGIEKGGLAAQISLLQRFLGLEPTPVEELLSMEVPELKKQFESLEAAYNLRFKDR